MAWELAGSLSKGKAGIVKGKQLWLSLEIKRIAPQEHAAAGAQGTGYLHGSERVTALLGLEGLHAEETKPSGKSCYNKA